MTRVGHPFGYVNVPEGTTDAGVYIHADSDNGGIQYVTTDNPDQLEDFADALREAAERLRHEHNKDT